MLGVAELLTRVRWGEGGGAWPAPGARLQSAEDGEATAMPQVSYCEAAQADKDTDTDADLVMQLRAGDESAIAQLVDQWSPAMFGVARSFVGSPQSAEDVVQEAWLGMLSGLAKFE